MKWALPEFSAQAGQRDRLIKVLLNISAHGLDDFLARISADRFRPAAQAFTEPGFFGSLRLREKCHVLAPRASRRARRAAIHAGRGHGKNKLAIAGPVASQHRLPPRVFYLGFCRVFDSVGHLWSIEYW